MSGGMTNIKGLPVCTDSDLYRYRVISWKSPIDQAKGDVVPGDYITGEGERNPPAVDSYNRKWTQEHFGPFHDCRLRSALYLDFEKPLSFGGNEKPYTDVPVCEKGQSLRRAMLGPSQDPDCRDHPTLQKCMPMATGLHEMALIPSHLFDPMDHLIESLKNYLSDAKAKDVCQKKNPDDKWALYWVNYSESRDAADELRSQLDKIKLEADPESQKKLFRRIVDKLPEVLRRCQSSEAEQDQMWAQYLKLMDKKRSSLKSKEDPSIRNGVVPGLAELLISEVKFYELKGDRRQFLENVLSLGLHHGVSEQWIMSAASDLTLHTSEEQTFLYGLLTVVMLQTAKGLHEANMAEGGPGISPEFSDFVFSVDEAIRDGRLSFQVKSAGDVLYGSRVFARYDPVKNQIVYPPLNSRYPLATLMDPIMHECVHAYQDLQAQPLAVFESELGAHEHGLRAAFLFSAHDIFDERAKSVLLEDQLDVYGWEDQLDFYRMKLGNEERSLKCLGADDETINRKSAIDIEDFFLRSKWRMEALGYPHGPGVLGYPSESSAETFRKGYKLTNFGAFFDMIVMRWWIEIGGLFDKINMAHIKMATKEKMLDDQRIKMQKTEETLSKARFIFDVAPGTPEHARGAFRYFYIYSALHAYTYYLDHERWKELRAQFYEEADFLGESLLYLNRPFDGI